MVYDLIIIGLGPGGISAAIYAQRSNLKILCLESKMPGGILNYIDKIDNYPGLPSISGANFSYRLFEQLNELAIPYKLEGVQKITIDNSNYLIETTKNTYKTKNIILASGREARKLNIPNEDKFLGRGISYCAVCDGAFFKNKTVAVVGGGSSALQEAVYLAKTVKKIYLIHRKNTFKADKLLVDKVLNCSNIEIIYNNEVIELFGDTSLNQIKLKDNTLLNVEGLFIYIGYNPNNSYLQDLNLKSSKDYLEVNENHETSAPGIYAIGDMTNKKYYQILSAMNEGMEAALNIAEKYN